MMLGASFTSLGVAAAGILLFGTDAPLLVVESLTLVAVLSTFVAICSLEARLAS